MTSSMCKQWDSGCTSFQSNILETPPATRQLPARSKAFVDRTLPADRRTRFCGPPPEVGPWFINGSQPEAGPWFIINRDNIEDRYLDNIEDRYLDNIKWYDEDLAAHGEVPVATAQQRWAPTPTGLIAEQRGEMNIALITK